MIEKNTYYSKDGAIYSLDSKHSTLELYVMSVHLYDKRTCEVEQKTVNITDGDAKGLKKYWLQDGDKYKVDGEAIRTITSIYTRTELRSSEIIVRSTDTNNKTQDIPAYIISNIGELEW